MGYTFGYSDALGAKDFSVDLRQHFPRPWRNTLRNEFVFIAGYVIILTIAFFQLGENITDNIDDGLFFDILSKLIFNIFFGGLLVISLMSIYHELFHASYYYGMDSGSLIIVQGVFTKRRSSYPLNKITDLYMNRGWLDLIFFLYNLNFSTANDMSYNYGRISGLSRDSAIGLQELLTRIVAEGVKYEQSE